MAGGAQLWVEEGGQDGPVLGAPGMTEVGRGPEGCSPVGPGLGKGPEVQVEDEASLTRAGKRGAQKHQQGPGRRAVRRWF